LITFGDTFTQRIKKEMDSMFKKKKGDEVEAKADEEEEGSGSNALQST
jgi:hypothetical protein